MKATQTELLDPSMRAQNDSAILPVRDGAITQPMREVPLDMNRLFERAMDKGESLTDLVGLKERMDAASAREKFASAMASAQSEMPKVVKDKTNTHTNSGYASLESVQTLIKPVYLRHGFTVSFSEGDPPRPDWVRVIAQVRHIGGHTETYHRDGPMDNVGAKGSPTKTALHGVASTATYLIRHLLCGIFSVTVAGEDKDGNNGAPITNEQLKDLNAMLTEAGRDIEAFLKLCDVDSLSEVSQRDYFKFRDAIRMMRNTSKKKESQ